MKKKWILLNAAVIIGGFFFAFFCAALQIQNQYWSEFSNRLDTALAILSTQTDELREDPSGTAGRIGKQLSSARQEMRISIITSATALNPKSTRTI